MLDDSVNASPVPKSWLSPGLGKTEKEFAGFDSNSPSPPSSAERLESKFDRPNAEVNGGASTGTGRFGFRRSSSLDDLHKDAVSSVHSARLSVDDAGVPVFPSELNRRVAALFSGFDATAPDDDTKAAAQTATPPVTRPDSRTLRHLDENVRGITNGADDATVSSSPLFRAASTDPSGLPVFAGELSRRVQSLFTGFAPTPTRDNAHKVKSLPLQRLEAEIDGVPAASMFGSMKDLSKSPGGDDDNIDAAVSDLGEVLRGLDIEGFAECSLCLKPGAHGADWFRIKTCGCQFHACCIKLWRTEAHNLCPKCGKGISNSVFFAKYMGRLLVPHEMDGTDASFDHVIRIKGELQEANRPCMVKLKVSSEYAYSKQCSWTVIAIFHV